jgi:hypothetical protein
MYLCILINPTQFNAADLEKLLTHAAETVKQAPLEELLRDRTGVPVTDDKNKKLGLLGFFE